MNRKRHSLLKRRSFVLLTICAAFLAFTCAPSNHTTDEIGYVPQRATVVRASALPKLEEVRKTSADADIHASRASDAVDRALAGSKGLKAGSQALAAEVMTLANQNSVYANELRGLLTKLAEQEKRTDQVIGDVTAARASLAAERQLRRQIQDKLIIVQQQVTGKEDEASRLREQLSHEQAVGSDLRNTAEKNAKRANTNADRASELEGKNDLKNKWIIGLSILALVELVALFLLARAKILP